MKLDGCGITLEYSKVSCLLFSELGWNFISFGSDGGILTRAETKLALLGYLRAVLVRAEVQLPEDLV